MLYDEIKKLSRNAKVPAEMKFEALKQTGARMKDISKSAEEAKQAMKNSIEEATVILIEDNKRIFKEIENIHIEQFKELKFPFDNFFIQFDMPSPEGTKDKMTFGLHVFPDTSIGLKSDQIYNVLMYNVKNDNYKQMVALMTILRLDMLPRFYIGCPKKCDKIIYPSNLGNLINSHVCQRTERTAEQCHVAQFLLIGIKTIIYVVNLINSKPKNLYGHKTQQAIKTSQSRENPKKDNVIGKYIYVHVDKLRRFKTIRPLGEIIKHRKSPVAHTRRGHYRTLSTGKIVWVNMSYVGLREEAHRKIYKLK